jgi:hypothetical protein
MSRHLETFSTVEMESEFRAQIWQNGNRILILFASNHLKNGLGPGTSFFARQRSKLETDQFRLVRDIHNHPFRFTHRSEDRGGTLVPSAHVFKDSEGHWMGGGDLPTAEHLAELTPLQSMIVINGFEANEIPRSQFSIYRELFEDGHSSVSPLALDTQL